MHCLAILTLFKKYKKRALRENFALIRDGEKDTFRAMRISLRRKEFLLEGHLLRLIHGRHLLHRRENRPEHQSIPQVSVDYQPERRRPGLYFSQNHPLSLPVPLLAESAGPLSDG